MSNSYSYNVITTLVLRLKIMLMLSPSSRTELRNIFSELDCVVISRHSHLSSWLPGFLCLVEGEDGIEL